MKKRSLFLTLVALSSIGLISEDVTAVNKEQLKRSSSILDLQALAKTCNWQPMTLEDYLACEVRYATETKGKINPGTSCWDDHVIDSVNDVTPKLKDLMNKFGVRADGDDKNGNHVFTIDLSLNSLIEVAIEKLKSTTEQRLDWTRFRGRSRGHRLTVGELKFLITNQNSPLYPVLIDLNQPKAREVHHCSVLYEDERNILTDLLINNLFGLTRLDDDEQAQFRDALCNRVLVNNTGCKRMLSLLIVAVLNSNSTTAFENSNHLNRIYIFNGDNFTIGGAVHVDFSQKNRLDWEIFHECTHVYLDLIGSYFTAKTHNDTFCGRELKFINWSIFNSNNPYLVKLFYPMLTKQNLEKLTARDSEQVALSQQNVANYYRIGIGNIAHDLQWDQKQPPLISSQVNGLVSECLPEWLHSNFAEMIDMIGIVPFKYGDNLYFVTDQQNENIYNNRKAALAKSRADLEQIRLSGVCRFHAGEDLYPEYRSELLKAGLPFYQSSGTKVRISNHDPKYIASHQDYLDSKCLDFLAAIKVARNSCDQD